jgi:AhpD family alkylhydroperoxidase
MEERMAQTKTRGPRLSPEAWRSPDAVAGVQQILKSIYAGGVPQPTLELVHMRASQINGCNGCIAYGIKAAESSGISAEKLLALPAFRESLQFDDAERAALALTEAVTRLADHPDVVTDEIWAEAAEHYDEPGLSALVSMAALTNFFNRVNTTLRAQPDSWGS